MELERLEALFINRDRLENSIHNDFSDNYIFLPDSKAYHEHLEKEINLILFQR